MDEQDRLREQVFSLEESISTLTFDRDQWKSEADTLRKMYDRAFKERNEARARCAAREKIAESQTKYSELMDALCSTAWLGRNRHESVVGLAKRLAKSQTILRPLELEDIALAERHSECVAELTAELERLRGEREQDTARLDRLLKKGIYLRYMSVGMRDREHIDIMLSEIDARDASIKKETK